MTVPAVRSRKQPNSATSKIKNCIHCNACKSRCPYGLDTPALLQKQLADYDAFYAAHHND